MKIIILFFAFLTHSTHIFAIDNKSKLIASVWTNEVIDSNGVPQQRTLIFNTESELQFSNHCQFSKLGWGPDLIAQINIPIHLTQTQITYLASKKNESFNPDHQLVCSAYAQSGFTDQYILLDDSTLLFAGVEFKVRQPPSSNKIFGHSYYYIQPANNQIKMKIIQDLTQKDTLKTTVHCFTPWAQLVAEVKSSVIIDENQLTLENPQPAYSQKVYDRAGNWCMAVIPKRKIKLSKTASGYFVIDDPLNPEGIEWKILN